MRPPPAALAAGNKGVVHDRLQMLHIHVLLVAPLGARHVAKSGADQHQGALPVAEIAQWTGFSDAAYFGKAFRAAFGMTPTQYRKRGGEAI